MDPRSKQPAWATLGLQVIAIICACALYNIASASVSGKRNVQGLHQPNQFPGIELVGGAQQKEKAPKLFFPSAIVRVNKALPDQVYTSSSHVILSDSDSMFFQWHLGRSRFTSCYIDSIVPTVEDGLAANKSYTSSGTITEIQIWNVTTPAEGIMSLSWNTQPRRINDHKCVPHQCRKEASVRGSERFGKVRTYVRTVRETADREPHSGSVRAKCRTVDRTKDEPDHWSGSNRSSGPDHGSTRTPEGDT
ncbi:hypothetical protein DFJ58DRAFT_746375 [Suillus subalutaceus]|uniref:uncharacterized protein n=1 Tax=Suillus subalutaceus TaxID=48586 RepID=UPI001B867BC0|nr:uncharacterized protein DFJ58DRAFT_746375 [Suillus subalutaceus]KAG1850814.1 hypothetical protein DFJ58DRAFT_746375 [Suillus subalutaceus]